MHLAMHEVCSLMEETDCVGARLQAQTQIQPIFPVVLLRLLYTEFNESFRQALERHQRVLWQDFEQLR